MQLNLYADAPRKRKHVGSVHTRKRQRPQPSKPTLPTTWKLPTLTARRDWVPRFLKHFQPVLVSDETVWAAPIGADGPVFSADLSAWLKGFAS